MLSMSQAAMWAGVSKATIHRAIKSGRISAEREDDGSYQIDPAELSRVFHMSSGGETHETDPSGNSETRRNTPQRGPDTSPAVIVAAELAAARQLTRSLQEQVAELRKSLQDQVEDLRGDRDGWRQQAETALRLLNEARAAASPRPWWRRLVDL
jgi:hypothetical protein